MFENKPDSEVTPQRRASQPGPEPIVAVPETEATVEIGSNEETQLLPRASTTAQLIHTGQHTPGVCLDRICLWLSPETRGEAGHKAMLLDGMTNSGRGISNPLRGEPRKREHYTSGFVVEKLPEMLESDLRGRNVLEALKLNPNKPALKDLLTVHTLETWLTRNAFEDPTFSIPCGFLKKGLEYRNNLYLYSRGLHLNTVNTLEPLKLGGKAPFFKSRYCTWRHGMRNEEKLCKHTAKFLKDKSAEEIFSMIYDVDRVKVGIQLLQSINKQCRILIPDYKKRFDGLPGDHHGGVAAAGIIALPDNQGVALWSFGDSIICQAKNGKLVYSSPYSSTGSYGNNAGISYCRPYFDEKDAMLPQREYKISEPRNINIHIIPKAKARESLFFMFSDGWHLGTHYDEFLKSLKGHLSDHEALIERANELHNTIDDKYHLRYPDYIPDDRSFLALDGSALF